MIFYAFIIAYCISTIGSIVSRSDQAKARFAEKLELLDRIHQECYLPLELYTQLKRTIRHRCDKDMENLNNFIDELPANLKVQTAIYIHEHTWRSIKFFEGGSDMFISWICPLLKPMLFPSGTVIYNEEDPVTGIYFH